VPRRPNKSKTAGGILRQLNFSSVGGGGKFFWFKRHKGWAQWLRPVILATWKA
jgi:hypothetical protein